MDTDRSNLSFDIIRTLATLPRIDFAVHFSTITRFVLDRPDLKSAWAKSRAGTLIARFGSAANLIIHLHGLVHDSVCGRTGVGLVFIKVSAPIDRQFRRRPIPVG